ncbi:hypothetical protein B0T16DRAFT_459358 [Cercophora newfieldiana]|uniref:Uncharacterized protein n=1 Tax=Cercophora newfieldiana TaxID=92897 RepID=A0AA39XZK0_9PEZI|nr:hypothetical protein B0T16DRAFT_459358 [Cercophora newfieldiana]
MLVSGGRRKNPFDVKQAGQARRYGNLAGNRMRVQIVEVGDAGELVHDGAAGIQKVEKLLEVAAAELKTTRSYAAARRFALASGRETRTSARLARGPKNDYDGKFGWYKNYVEELVNPQLAAFMNNFELDNEKKIGGGNRFFNCKYKEYDSDANWLYQGPCPVPESIMKRSEWDDPSDPAGPDDWVIHYTCINETGFKQALTEELGILPNWYKWEDWGGWDECCQAQPGDCPIVRHQWLRGHFPRKADIIDVPNPKEIMEKAQANITALRSHFLSATLGAIDNMEKIKDIGDELEAAAKKECIMLILGLVFLLVPFLAEFGALIAGLTTLARFIAIAGEVGNVALGIPGIIEDTRSVPLVVLGVLAGRGRKVEDIMTEVATARLALNAVDIGKMGQKFKVLDDKIQHLITRCTK